MPISDSLQLITPLPLFDLDTLLNSTNDTAVLNQFPDTCQSFSDCKTKLSLLEALDPSTKTNNFDDQLPFLAKKAALQKQKATYEADITKAKTAQNFSLGGLFAGGCIAIATLLIPEVAIPLEATELMALSGVGILGVSGVANVEFIDMEHTAKTGKQHK